MGVLPICSDPRFDLIMADPRLCRKPRDPRDPPSALCGSSLKILHEMRVLTATDPPPATALTLGNSASSSSSPPQDAAAAAAAAPGGPFAYLHDTAKEIQPMSTGAESAAAIDKFHKVERVRPLLAGARTRPYAVW